MGGQYRVGLVGLTAPKNAGAPGAVSGVTAAREGCCRKTAMLDGEHALGSWNALAQRGRLGALG